jgi:acetoin utilization deacetylase AcuC-like enzyme
VLEGGYDLAALASSCAATLEGLRGGGEPQAVDPHPLVVEAARVVGRRWPLPLATS